MMAPLASKPRIASIITYVRPGLLQTAIMVVMSLLAVHELVIQYICSCAALLWVAVAVQALSMVVAWATASPASAASPQMLKTQTLHR
jgi:hypothetical protein